MQETNLSNFTRTIINQYKNLEQEYAIFDWDETCVISDTQDMFVYYILKNNLCKIKDEDIKGILTKEFHNNIHKTSDYFKLVEDIVIAYKKSNDYIYNLELISKVFYTYKYINSMFNRKKAYRWMTNFLFGYSYNELSSIIRILLVEYSKEKVKNIEFISPNIDSHFGQVRFNYSIGLKPREVIVELLKKFKDKGLNIYIVSSSVEDLIKAATRIQPYNELINEDNVYGIRLKKVEGKYINTFVGKTPIPIKEGKTAIIKKYIMPNHKSREPFIVVGDSFGDYKMMVDFPNTKFILLLNNKNKLLKTLIKKNKGNSTMIVIDD